MPIAKMIVTFDDAEPLVIESKPRDLANAEREGTDFAATGPVISLYATALATLNRLSREGGLPDGVTLPASVEAFVDCADVEIDGEPEGEGSGQAATSG